MQKINTPLSLFFVILVAGSILNGCTADSTNDETKNEKVKVDFGSKVKIKGMIACLPKKGDGPHTLECAYGLKADSIYYRLKKVPDHALENGLLQQKKSVMVRGTLLKPEMNSSYQMVAVIKVDTVALANPKGSQDWKQVDKEQFTMLTPSYWKDGSIFTDAWSALSVKTKGRLLFAVHTPGKYLENTNFGGLQITVGKSNLEKAMAHCLSPLENINIKRRKETINNIKFSVIQTSDAATGDRYVITSYRTKHNNACWAVETVLNYSPIEFYGKESGVREFNRPKIEKQIKAIVRTFIFKRKIESNKSKNNI